MFPKIDRPCPYADRIASVMDGDFCRMCSRSVTDLSAMAPGERSAFLSECRTEEVCVSYTVKLSVAAALAAVALPGVAYAQQQETTPVAATEAPAEEPLTIIALGGIRGIPMRVSDQPVQLITSADLTRSERRRRTPRKRTH